MKTIRTSIAAIFLMLGCGCHKVPMALVARALDSTNVVFQTYRQQPITLPAPCAEGIIRVVRAFQDPARVELRKDVLPANSGVFVFGDVSFGWVGTLLCLKDPDAQKYYVVQDAALGKMAEVYFSKLGPPPGHELSREEWQEVLAVLKTTK